MLSTRDDIRLVIPYVEFSKQVRGIRPMLLDTSVLIDGRYNALPERLPRRAAVPRCVIDELPTLRLERPAQAERGRRACPICVPAAAARDPGQHRGTGCQGGHGRQALMDHAEKNQLRLVTTDSNLLRVAEIRRISTLNLHDLSIVMQESATRANSSRWRSSGPARRTRGSPTCPMEPWSSSRGAAMPSNGSSRRW